MRTHLKQTIKLLQDQVYANLKEIKKNEALIREMLKEPVSDFRSQRLHERQSINKKFLNENKESIKIQNSILHLLQMWKEAGHEVPELENANTLLQETLENEGEGVSESKVEACVSDPEQCFQMTIKGEMSFDEDHPFYDDIDFIDKLLSYYTEKEEYEACSNLMDIRSKVERLHSA